MDDAIGDGDTSLSYDIHHLTKTKSICSDDESLKTMTVLSTESNTETKTTPQATPEMTSIELRYNKFILSTQDSHDEDLVNAFERITVTDNGLLMLPETHPEYLNLIRLQLENQELTQWKQRLQYRIQSERAEIVRLKAILNSKLTSNSINQPIESNNIPDDGSYERIVTHFVHENTLLELKKDTLAKEIFDENKELVRLQVELAIRKFQI